MTRQDLREFLTPCFNDAVLTERLVVRPLRLEDTEALTAYFTGDDYDPPKYLGWPTNRNYNETPVSDCEIPYILNNQTMADTLYLALFTRVDNRIVGDLLFQEDMYQRLRISYYVTPSERRQGYAFEAYCAARDRVEDRIGRRVVYEEVLAGNKASERFLEKAGFHAIGRRPGSYEADKDKIFNAFFRAP